MTDNLPAIRPTQLTTLDDAQLGDVLVKSGFFKDATDQAKALVKVLYGREVGIGPIAAMKGIHVIEGSPSMGAGLIGALIKRSGKYNYRVRRHDNTGSEIEFFENGEPVGKIAFTMEDAKTAGLLGKQNWQRYPRAMCFARALSEGARTFCPDVFDGPIYTPEELGAEVRINSASGEQEVIECEIIQPTPAPAGMTLPPQVDASINAQTPPVEGTRCSDCGKGFAPNVIKAYNDHGTAPEERRCKACREAAATKAQSLQQQEDDNEVPDDPFSG